MTIPRSIDFIHELNPQQQAVVTAGDGPLLVIAGAGSGKTRTLTYRVAYLVRSGVQPHRILLLTFTNKAAREMLHRVEQLAPCEVHALWGGTFHHIANRTLRVHGQRIGLDPNFTILDQSDAVGLLDGCLRDLGYKKKDTMIPHGAALFSIISLARNTCTPIHDIVETRFPYFSGCIDDMRAAEDLYTRKKQNMNVVDFDDLLCLWLRLLQEEQQLKDFYAQRFQYIFVDEYQDTNTLQATIIDLLASEHRNLMVVGDDAQSIYAFRGANYTNIMGFPERYPDARLFKLEYNYRSTPAILSLANQSILCNTYQFQKNLRPVKTGGTSPCLVRPHDVYQQAQFVADAIRAAIRQGIPSNEIAVLYRAHYHSMELQMELSRRGIAYEVRSGIRFFEQAHIKDIVSYLKIVQNPHDATAWSRILQLLPGIGAKTAQKIHTHIAQAADPLQASIHDQVTALVPRGAQPYWHGMQEVLGSLLATGKESSPAALVKLVLEHGYRELLRSKYTDSASRLEDIEQLISFAWQYESLIDFLSELALLTSSESEQVRPEDMPDTIKLSTIHQAKGLEWTLVFIIWLVEGRFPNPNNFDGPEDEEEERRLFYVAVTRAKEHLILCAPETNRDANGYITFFKPSRFVRELPDHCYTVAVPLNGSAEVLRIYEQ
ncbi:MAG: ATP-dependent helicase [Desulfobacterota bacterium]|nr:ATP-dependent helicase [Thermodesulfobacteriota bacterium]